MTWQPEGFQVKKLAKRTRQRCFFVHATDTAVHNENARKGELARPDSQATNLPCLWMPNYRQSTQAIVTFGRVSPIADMISIACWIAKVECLSVATFRSSLGKKSLNRK